MASPARRASSWSGIQSPVNTTVSHGTNRAAPGPQVRQVHRRPTRARAAPATRRTAVDVHTGTRQRSAAPSRNAA